MNYVTFEGISLKTALQMVGLDVGSVRLPLLPLTEEERVTLQSVMQSIPR